MLRNKGPIMHTYMCKYIYLDSYSKYKYVSITTHLCVYLKGNTHFFWLGLKLIKVEILI